MTQEEKDLLLKDLCARLPYKVECEAILNNGGNYPCVLNIGTLNQHIAGDHVLKPYLRPLSSMTEEEDEEYRKTKIRVAVQWDDYGNPIGFELISTFETFDWLNARHFDYRGLIEKGLALEAPEGMYNIKEK